MREILRSLCLWYAGAKISALESDDMRAAKKRLTTIGVFIMIQQVIVFLSFGILALYYVKNYITPALFGLTMSILVYNIIRPYFSNNKSINSKLHSNAIPPTGVFLFVLGFACTIPFLLMNLKDDFGTRFLAYINKTQADGVWASMWVISLSIVSGILFVIPVLLKKSFNWDLYYQACLKIDNNEATKNNPVNPKDGSIIDNFPGYFITLVDAINKQIYKTNENANKEFTKGIVITLIGIFIYIGFLFFWLDYFSNPSREYNQYKYFGLISSSMLFLFIEGIGLWFLKHNRYLLNNSNSLLKYRIEIEKHYLNYFYVQENIKNFTTESERLKLLDNVISKLGSVTIIQEGGRNELDKGSSSDIINLLKSISENVSKISK